MLVSCNIVLGGNFLEPISFFSYKYSKLKCLGCAKYFLFRIFIIFFDFFEEKNQVCRQCTAVWHGYNVPPSPVGIHQPFQHLHNPQQEPCCTKPIILIYLKTCCINWAADASLHSNHPLFFFMLSGLCNNFTPC